MADVGILYVIFNKWIRNPETNEMPYKIGITKNSVADRYYGLGLKMPGKFETLFAYKLKNYADAEKAIGIILNERNINGEWYDLNEDNLVFIEATCKQMNGIIITEEIENEIKNATEPSFDLVQDSIISQTKVNTEPVSLKNTGYNENTIDKLDAINLLNKKYNLSLNNKNTTFSNINTVKPIYWFDPRNDRFKNNFNLILYNNKIRVIYYFVIPANEIDKPERIFYQRPDKKNISQIKIDINDDEFKDILRGFIFKKYLKYKIQL
jgi:hypothetical protein